VLTRLRSPELWIGSLIVFGGFGVLCLALGKAVAATWLYWAGVALCIPGVLALLLLVVFIIPVLLISNWKHRHIR
jgi:hypothetical protein